MFGASLFELLLIVWGAITLAFLAVMGWKSIVGLHEDGGIILDPAESRQESEQQHVVAQVERLGHWAKGFGFASLGFLVLIIGILGYRGWLTFMGTRLPQ